MTEEEIIRWLENSDFKSNRKKDIEAVERFIRFILQRIQ